MGVKEIIEGKGRTVVTGDPRMTVHDALQLLAHHRIGAILVTAEDGGIAGILSERDIVRSIARAGAEILHDPVAGHMTREVTTCGPTASISDVMELMTRGRFRHLPVVEGGRLAGIISIGDVVKQRLAEAERDADEMRAYITAG